jgi:hypothetical protein
MWKPFRGKNMSKHVETFIPIYTVLSQMPIASGTKTTERYEKFSIGFLYVVVSFPPISR